LKAMAEEYATPVARKLAVGRPQRAFNNAPAL
jgi:hypothetical protein